VARERVLDDGESEPGAAGLARAATFGLVFVVLSCARERASWAPAAVAAYIAAAYWYTASTSFANPAVTLARGFTATFAGIDLAHVPAFVLAQCVGAALALLAERLIQR
jgi:glycerol uptake facilitator-like aquaporin